MNIFYTNSITFLMSCKNMMYEEKLFLRIIVISQKWILSRVSNCFFHGVVLTPLLHAILTFPRGQRALRERERIPRATVLKIIRYRACARARAREEWRLIIIRRIVGLPRVVGLSRVVKSPTQISPYLDFTQSSVAENRVARTTD